ncbi:MAG: DUF3822 family protein [Bacteroidia bacterium]
MATDLWLNIYLTHSVSHNLILELNGNDFTIATVKKDGLVVNLKFYPLVDQAIMEGVLVELPEIYSDVTLLIRKKDFITLPESFFTSNISEIYKLNYIISEGDRVWLDKLDNGLGIAYAIDVAIADVTAAKFPRIKIIHEATVILKKLFKEVNFKEPKIIISINTGSLIIYAIKDGKLLICNSFQAKSNDDIFYFVMLTVEQLHFLPAETELVILGEPPMRAEIFELFKNYIKEINIWMEDYQFSPEIKNTELLAYSFALQTLICE